MTTIFVSIFFMDTSIENINILEYNILKFQKISIQNYSQKGINKLNHFKSILFPRELRSEKICENNDMFSLVIANLITIICINNWHKNS